MSFALFGVLFSATSLCIALWQWRTASRRLEASKRALESIARRPLVPYEQLNTEGKLERLARADAVLGFVVGDEPFLGGRMCRKECGR